MRPSESESRTPAATSGAKGLRTWAERGELCEASADKYSLPELGACGPPPSLRRGEEGLWPPRRPSPNTRRNKKRRDAARSRRDSLNSKGRRSSALGGIAGFGGSQTSLAGAEQPAVPHGMAVRRRCTTGGCGHAGRDPSGARCDPSSSSDPIFGSELGLGRLDTTRK